GQFPQPLLVRQLLQRFGFLRVRFQEKSTTRERSNHQRHLANSGGWVPVKEYSPEYQGADMAEIDARLKALQEYMNRLDTRS
ncbi:coiled-coil domain-containing protein 61, partial [Cricetulus griseus]